MTPTDAQRTFVEEAVSAPATAVFRLLADENDWPRVFPSFVHLENLGADGGWDRIGMWALSGGTAIEHWSALRRVDDAALRVEFRPEALPPSLESMTRSWVVTPAADGQCLVRLEHEYRMKDPDPAAAEEVRSRAEEIARTEVAAVRRAAELDARRPGTLVVVRDRVTVGAPREKVFDVLFEAGEWPRFMSHVARAEVSASGAGRAHLLELETVEADGRLFRTRTARVGAAPHTVAYKQLLLPPLGRSHHVRWRLVEQGGATVVHAVQTAVVEESGIAAVLGEGADLRAAGDFVRSELGSKVRLLLRAVKEHLEAAG